MTSSQNKINTVTLMRYLGYGVVSTVILLVTMSIFYRQDGLYVLRENRFLETVQLGLLILAGFVLLNAACHTSQYSRFLMLLFLLILIAVIREMDGIFDQCIFHGSWAFIALLPVIAILCLIRRNPPRLLTEFNRFYCTQEMIFLGIGFYIVTIFSQLCGRQVVWRVILGEQYVREVGRYVEELLELLGYMLLTIGSLECYWNARKNQSRERP